MSEEDDRSEVKAQLGDSEMVEQDTVMIMTGTLVREGEGPWLFDTQTEEGTKFITVKSGLGYEELVHLVKDCLAIDSANVTLKLSYQYPTWMLIDDGDGSAPQFISDDHELEVFVQMRQKIEEVNLFVTISQCIDGVTTAQDKPHFSNVTDQTLLDKDDGDTETTDATTEEEWLEFALSETPLTCPPQKNTAGGSFRVTEQDTIPYRHNGIEIQENQPIILLLSPQNSSETRGKGKELALEVAPAYEPYDFGVRNSLRRIEHTTGEGEPNRPVKRRLFPTSRTASEAEMELVPTQGPDETFHQPEPATQAVGGEGSSGLTHWTSFQDALHQILDDETSQNAQSGQFNMVNVHAGTCTCKETEIGGTFAGALMPPAVKRPPSRPRKQRILSTGEDKRYSQKHAGNVLAVGEKATTRPHVVVQNKYVRKKAGLKKDGL
ncbi:hypothetical protein DY000_02040060 [Brassica cretica]|uniref:PB1 domain-containing protein n=1 Tax=Brassica cretica TaxID=69181 RepID=A0ABQ7BJ05_BRACR|nr:hypothetical protein DY000_02040060 [Brassica cretica]